MGANAYQYGEYAGETLERLITDYPGRYRGTASFAGASKLMQSRLGFGYQTSRQDFTWAGNRSSQNVIASAPGSSGKFLVLGAHWPGGACAEAQAPPIHLCIPFRGYFPSQELNAAPHFQARK